MCYFNFYDWQLIGSSPEVMVKATRTDASQPQVATVRPIAGTRPRGKTAAEDAAYAPICWPTPKKGPSTSCWWTWVAMTWAGSASAAPCRSMS